MVISMELNGVMYQGVLFATDNKLTDNKVQEVSNS